MNLSLAEVLVAHTRMSENGRIVIPVAMREKLGLKSGDAVVLTFEDGRLILQSYEATLQDIQQRIRALVGPDRSLSDELIADRREEWRREMAEMGLNEDGSEVRAEEIGRIA
jgi:AbrB family looped-hinge helix DNA binding protein